jgi:molybdopterin/thiamine biosynthesis adenylyltransferase
MPFTPEQVQRYARHLILPEVGSAGQRKLLNSRVLLLGAGGLGSPAALYLAAAGVGHLGIVDADVVDLTNLQRQILHHTNDVGRLKVDSAITTLHAINPDVEVIAHPVRIDSSNALDLFAAYDLVLDGTDNFPTRYLANDAAYWAAKPLIQASIFRFEGNLAMFDPAHTPGCYRCLFPSPPAPGDVPSCAEAGVFGVLPGILGSLMAFEALKFLLNYGESLLGSLLVFEGYDLSFRKLKLRAMPSCPLCSPNRTLTGLIDYEQFCGLT